MNIRANCCRCLGGLIRCLDGMVIDQADPDAIIHDEEFNSVTVDIIDAIILNISTGKAMKVMFVVKTYHSHLIEIINALRLFQMIMYKLLNVSNRFDGMRVMQPEQCSIHHIYLKTRS